MVITIDAQKLSRGLPGELIDILHTFRKNGYEAYVVGGALRDMMLGRKAYDYDIATNALPGDVQRMFHRTAPVGIEFGTVTILGSERQYECTTYRRDGRYVDGRRPQSVSFSKTIDEDLKRRDFTINAFALDPIRDKLIDNHDGIDDLREKIIRTIGDPNERFREDGLRIMRACRFAAVLGFSINSDTMNAMRMNIDVAYNVSIERFKDELIKMMSAPQPSIGIESMRACGLLEFLLPELASCADVEQNKFHKHDVYYHCLYSCDAAPADNYRVRIAALLHDIGKPITKRVGGQLTETERERLIAQGQPADSGDATFYNHEVVGSSITKRILKRLRFSNDDVQIITALVRHHMFYYTEEWTDSAVRRFMRRVTLERVEDLFALREADRIGNGTKAGRSKSLGKLLNRIQAIIDAENAFSLKDLKINGLDVMEIKKLKEGRAVGEILNYLLERVLDEPELNTRETLAKMVEDYDLANPPAVPKEEE